LYERTPEGEVLSHKVFDGYGLNGMSADDFVFERKYGESDWSLTFIHIERQKAGFYKSIADIHSEKIYVAHPATKDNEIQYGLLQVNPEVLKKYILVTNK
jgi:hypothetical protein